MRTSSGSPRVRNRGRESSTKTRQYSALDGGRSASSPTVYAELAMVQRSPLLPEPLVVLGIHEPVVATLPLIPGEVEEFAEAQPGVVVVTPFPGHGVGGEVSDL